MGLLHPYAWPMQRLIEFPQGRQSDYNPSQDTKRKCYMSEMALPYYGTIAHCMVSDTRRPANVTILHAGKVGVFLWH